MRHPEFTESIAYASIFQRDPEGAAAHLVGLISRRECDQGPAAWREGLRELMEASEEMGRLNQFGAQFTLAQWRVILEQVHAALEDRED